MTEGLPDDWITRSVKARDGFFTTFLVSSYSPRLVRWCAAAGIKPNSVSVASMILGFLAAASFGVGERWALIAGAVLLQVSFTFDCVDGQLARATDTTTRWGAWLDASFDRLKEMLVYFGLAWGWTRTVGGDEVWTFAIVALALLATKHAVLSSYDAVQPGSVPAHAQHVGALGWLRRVIPLPIGERFAVISVTAAVADARVTFWVLMVWGSIALAWTVSGRLVRSLA